MTVTTFTCRTCIFDFYSLRAFEKVPTWRGLVKAEKSNISIIDLSRNRSNSLQRQNFHAAHPYSTSTRRELSKKYQHDGVWWRLKNRIFRLSIYRKIDRIRHSDKISRPHMHIWILLVESFRKSTNMMGFGEGCKNRIFRISIFRKIDKFRHRNENLLPHIVSWTLLAKSFRSTTHTMGQNGRIPHFYFYGAFLGTQNLNNFKTFQFQNLEKRRDTALEILAGLSNAP